MAPPKDKRPITLADEDEEMELVGPDGAARDRATKGAMPGAQRAAGVPEEAMTTPRLTPLPHPAVRLSRPFTEAETERLRTALHNQGESRRILQAVRALLQDKGLL